MCETSKEERDEDGRVKKIIYRVDGTPMAVWAHPNGNTLEAFENYEKKLEEARKQYGHLFKQCTVDDFIAEKRREAELEWRE